MQRAESAVEQHSKTFSSFIWCVRSLTPTCTRYLCTLTTMLNICRSWCEFVKPDISAQALRWISCSEESQVIGGRFGYIRVFSTTFALLHAPYLLNSAEQGQESPTSVLSIWKIIYIHIYISGVCTPLFWSCMRQEVFKEVNV